MNWCIHNSETTPSGNRDPESPETCLTRTSSLAWELRAILWYNHSSRLPPLVTGCRNFWLTAVVNPAKKRRCSYRLMSFCGRYLASPTTSRAFYFKPGVLAKCIDSRWDFTRSDRRSSAVGRDQVELPDALLSMASQAKDVGICPGWWGQLSPRRPKLIGLWVKTLVP